VRTRDTAHELALRRELFARGLRYRVDVRPESSIPRRADTVFRSARVAVFSDGCYWHGCPEHGSWPRTNCEWWRRKIEATRARDEDTTVRLRAAGWTVFRVWEHENLVAAATRIESAVRSASHATPLDESQELDAGARMP
jgi:DNA mismatch endonuclease (patch repair protein)